MAAFSCRAFARPPGGVESCPSCAPQPALFPSCRDGASRCASVQASARPRDLAPSRSTRNRSPPEPARRGHVVLDLSELIQGSDQDTSDPGPLPGSTVSGVPADPPESPRGSRGQAAPPSGSGASVPAPPKSSRGWGWGDTREAKLRRERDADRRTPTESPLPQASPGSLEGPRGERDSWPREREGEGRPSAGSKLRAPGSRGTPRLGHTGGSQKSALPSRGGATAPYSQGRDGASPRGHGSMRQGRQGGEEEEEAEAEKDEWRERETEDWSAWGKEYEEEEEEEEGDGHSVSAPAGRERGPHDVRREGASLGDPSLSPSGGRGLFSSQTTGGHNRSANTNRVDADTSMDSTRPHVRSEGSRGATPGPLSTSSAPPASRKGADRATRGGGRHAVAATVDVGVAQEVAGEKDLEQQVMLGNAWDALNCQHFSLCSGCSHSEGMRNPPIAGEAKDVMASFGVHSFQILTPLTSGWRCRAKLVVRSSPSSPVIVGLYETGTHNAVDIPLCQAHHPRLNQAAQLIRELVEQMQIPPYHEDSGTGRLRYVQLVLTTHNTSIPASERYAQGQVQVSLVWNARDDKSPEAASLLPLAQELWRRGGLSGAAGGKLPLVHSVWANFQTSRSNVIFGGRWRHLLGDARAWEQFSPGVETLLMPGSFGQANYQGFSLLLKLLKRCVPHGASVTELYAGAGVVGLCLAAARSCRRVRCVEINPESQQAYEQSLMRLHPALRKRVSWHCADATQDPIKWLGSAEVVVVDPPRKGLEDSVLSALRAKAQQALAKRAGVKGAPGEVTLPAPREAKASAAPWKKRQPQDEAGDAEIDVELEEGEEMGFLSTLIYISCGWEAFKRDCALLTKDGVWHLAEAVGINLFPGTNSIETLAVFKIGKRPKKPGPPRLVLEDFSRKKKAPEEPRGRRTQRNKVATKAAFKRR